MLARHSFQPMFTSLDAQPHTLQVVSRFLFSLSDSICVVFVGRTMFAMCQCNSTRPSRTTLLPSMTTRKARNSMKRPKTQQQNHTKFICFQWCLANVPICWTFHVEFTSSYVEWPSFFAWKHVAGKCWHHVFVILWYLVTATPSWSQA